MLQQGVVPDAIAYRSLISACEKGKQPETVIKVFAAMMQQGVVPDAIAYRTLISACEKGKQPEL